MNTFQPAIFSHRTHASNYQDLNNLSSEELCNDLQLVALERDIDRVDSSRQLDTSNFEKTRQLGEDEWVRTDDAAREYVRHLLDSELAHQLGTEGFPKEGASYRDQISKFLKFGVPHHTSKIPSKISEIDTLNAIVQKAELNWNSDSQRSNHGHKALVLLAKAKKLLSEQRIQDARRILQSGTHQYPKDTGIARLLRAISPGQVTKVKSEAANGNQEIAWIQQHGKKYQEQWIAVCNDELLASSRSLKSLLDKLKQRKGKVEPVTIQYIVSE